MSIVNDEEKAHKFKNCCEPSHGVVIKEHNSIQQVQFLYEQNNLWIQWCHSKQLSLQRAHPSAWIYLEQVLLWGCLNVRGKVGQPSTLLPSEFPQISDKQSLLDSVHWPLEQESHCLFISSVGLVLKEGKGFLDFHIEQ